MTLGIKVILVVLLSKFDNGGIIIKYFFFGVIIFI